MFLLPKCGISSHSTAIRRTVKVVAARKLAGMRRSVVTQGDRAFASPRQSFERSFCRTAAIAPDNDLYLWDG